MKRRRNISTFVFGTLQLHTFYGASPMCITPAKITTFYSDSRKKGVHALIKQDISSYLTTFFYPCHPFEWSKKRYFVQNIYMLNMSV